MLTFYGACGNVIRMRIEAYSGQSRGERGERQHPNHVYVRRRIGAAVAAVLGLATFLGLYKGAEAIVKTTPVATRRVHIPNVTEEDIANGTLPGQVTIDQVCKTAQDLVNETDLPPGVDSGEKQDIVGTCTSAAQEAIDNAGARGYEIPGSDVVVKINRGFFGNYSVSADALNTEQSLLKKHPR